MRVVFSLASLAAILLAAPPGASASPLRPPDGTYTYALSVGSSILGKSTVVIATAGDAVAVTEKAAFPQVKGVIATRYDAATLTQTQYAADFNLASGSQHTAAVFKPGSITLTAGAQSVDIPADPAAPLEVVTDNLVGTAIMIPAIVNAHGARALTLAVTSGGTAVLAKVSLPSSPPARPAAARAGDHYLALDAGALHENFWYDPVSGVVDEIDVPAQSAQIVLVSHSSTVTALGTRSGSGRWSRWERWPPACGSGAARSASGKATPWFSMIG